MALLEIVIEGDPILRAKARKISRVDDGIRALAENMYETIPVANGVAVAAPQVGESVRLIVIRYLEADEGDDPEKATEVTYRLANPEIIRGHGEQIDQEGCLSIPGWIGDVPRYDSITVKAIDMDNKPVRIKASGYLARVFQHEIDHLDGILFTDRVVDRSTLRFLGNGENDEPVE
jgi:peptide deformylase